jgi:hypothetical protein
MIKRAISKPPRVFVLKVKYRALGADPMQPLSRCAVFEPSNARSAEAEPARVQVVQSRAGRVREQAAGPRAS